MRTYVLNMLILAILSSLFACASQPVAVRSLASKASLSTENAQIANTIREIAVRELVLSLSENQYINITYKQKGYSKLHTKIYSVARFLDFYQGKEFSTLSILAVQEGDLKSPPKQVLVEYASGHRGTFTGTPKMISEIKRQPHVFKVHTGPPPDWVPSILDIPDNEKNKEFKFIKSLEAKLGSETSPKGENTLEGISDAIVFHGTISAHEKRIKSGIENIGKGFGGQGLYLALESNYSLADYYATNARQAYLSAQEQDPNLSKKLVMQGIVNPDLPLKVGRFVISYTSSPNLETGELPRNWDKDPALIKLLNQTFDVLDIRGLSIVSLGVNDRGEPIDRMLVVKARSPANTILWKTRSEIFDIAYNRFLSRLKKAQDHNSQQVLHDYAEIYSLITHLEMQTELTLRYYENEGSLLKDKSINPIFVQKQLDELIQILREDPKPAMRARAAKALGNSEVTDDRVLDPLIRVIKSGEIPVVVRKAQEALGKSGRGNPKALAVLDLQIDKLISLFLDPSAHINNLDSMELYYENSYSLSKAIHNYGPSEESIRLLKKLFFKYRNLAVDIEILPEHSSLRARESEPILKRDPITGESIINWHTALEKRIWTAEGEAKDVFKTIIRWCSDNPVYLTHALDIISELYLANPPKIGLRTSLLQILIDTPNLEQAFKNKLALEWVETLLKNAIKVKTNSSNHNDVFLVDDFSTTSHRPTDRFDSRILISVILRFGLSSPIISEIIQKLVASPLVSKEVKVICSLVLARDGMVTPEFDASLKTHPGGLANLNPNYSSKKYVDLLTKQILTSTEKWQIDEAVKILRDWAEDYIPAEKALREIASKQPVLMSDHELEAINRLIARKDAEIRQKRIETAQEVVIGFKRFFIASAIKDTFYFVWDQTGGDGTETFEEFLEQLRGLMTLETGAGYTAMAGSSALLQTMMRASVSGGARSAASEKFGKAMYKYLTSPLGKVSTHALILTMGLQADRIARLTVKNLSLEKMLIGEGLIDAMALAINQWWDQLDKKQVGLTATSFLASTAIVNASKNIYKTLKVIRNANTVTKATKVTGAGFVPSVLTEAAIFVLAEVPLRMYAKYLEREEVTKRFGKIEKLFRNTDAIGVATSYPPNISRNFDELRDIRKAWLLTKHPKVAPAYQKFMKSLEGASHALAGYGLEKNSGNFNHSVAFGHGDVLMDRAYHRCVQGLHPGTLDELSVSNEYRNDLCSGHAHPTVLKKAQCQYLSFIIGLEDRLWQLEIDRAKLQFLIEAIESQSTLKLKANLASIYNLKNPEEKDYWKIENITRQDLFDLEDNILAALLRNGGYEVHQEHGDITPNIRHIPTSDADPELGQMLLAYYSKFNQQKALRDHFKYLQKELLNTDTPATPEIAVIQPMERIHIFHKLAETRIDGEYIDRNHPYLTDSRVSVLQQILSWDRLWQDFNHSFSSSVNRSHVWEDDIDKITLNTFKKDLYFEQCIAVQINCGLARSIGISDATLLPVLFRNNSGALYQYRCEDTPFDIELNPFQVEFIDLAYQIIPLYIPSD
jgi:hypothetical protein